MSVRSLVYSVPCSKEFVIFKKGADGKLFASSTCSRDEFLDLYSLLEVETFVCFGDFTQVCFKEV